MPLEYPAQDIFPGSKMRLTVRFEEFTSELLQNDVPPKPAKNIVGVSDTRGNLVVTKDPDAPPGVTRFVLQSPIPSTPGDSSTQAKSRDDLTHVVSGVIPRKASWKQNGFRTGDSLSAEIRWVDFPIDPRIVRSVSVEYYLGTVTAQEYAMGIRGAKRGDLLGAGAPNANEPLNVIPDTYVDGEGRQRTNLRFLGWVDKYASSISADASIVKLECADNTRLFIKQQAAAGHGIAYDKPIDEAVALYLSVYPQFEGISVEYRPTTVRDDTHPPRLGKVLTNTSFAPNLGIPLARGGGAAGGETLSVWDNLTDICGAIGHIIRIDGDRLIIQQMRDVLDGRAGARQDDPYRTRKLPSGDYEVRTFIYGRNLLSLETSRDFSRREPSSIEARSYNPARKNMLVARWPPAGQRVVSAHPGDGKADQKWTVVRVPGIIADQATLSTFAQNYYNAMNRQELTVEFKTRNVSSFGGGNEDPDLLDAKPGDTVDFLVDRSQNFNSMTAIERQLSAPALNEKLLTDLGFTKEFAAAAARAYTNAGFQRSYRLKTLAIDWSTDSGVSFAGVGQNFIEVRLDKPAAVAPVQDGVGGSPDPTAAR